MMEHDLIKTGDPDSCAAIEDGHGQVVLAFCRRCKKGEVELGPECTWPGPGRDEVCEVCDGGPGNSCSCSCGHQAFASKRAFIVPLPDGPLFTACLHFAVARTALQTAESALNVEVSHELKSCKTIDDHQQLIYRLPKGYPGVRRIYEIIERIIDQPPKEPV